MNFCGVTQYSHRATGWTIEVQFLPEAGIFLFPTSPRPTLGPTHSPVKILPAALSLGVTRSGREADHSPLSFVEVNKV
jgi:hypothetical protein